MHHLYIAIHIKYVVSIFLESYMYCVKISTVCTKQQTCTGYMQITCHIPNWSESHRFDVIITIVFEKLQLLLPDPTSSQTIITIDNSDSPFSVKTWKWCLIGKLVNLSQHSNVQNFYCSVCIDLLVTNTSHLTLNRPPPHFNSIVK